MALHIHNNQTEELVALILAITGETKTDAIAKALEERLARLQRQRGSRRLSDELNEIALHCASLPVFDDRLAEEIIGYDERGFPN